MNPGTDSLIPQISRRGFLRSGAATTAVLSLSSVTTASSPSATKTAAGSPRKLTPAAPQVFVDLSHVELLENVRHLFHTAEKHPDNPVLDGEKEWERVMGGPCASFIFDEEEKLFKVWYQGIIGDRRGRVPTHGPYTLNYAISRDGVHWERPNLGLHEFNWQGQSTRDNNIVVPQTWHEGMDHWESVLRDPFDPDPQRRYKAIGWSSLGPGEDGSWCAAVGKCGIWSMCSPDGLNWTHSQEPIFHYRPRPGTNDIGPVGDAQTLMIDPHNRRYVALLRGTQGNRLFSTSDDFVHWSGLQESMSAVPGKAGSPLYNHMGFLYGDQYLGFVSHYVVEEDGVHHLRVRLLSSRDGLHFDFPGADALTRPALIDVAEIGEWDRFMCMITGAPPIRVGDKLHIYYRGYAETHDRSADKPKDSYFAGANGLATIRLDGFASLAAGFDGGFVTTTPFLFEGGMLTINAKANFYASVIVEVLDDAGEPIAGYAAADCVPMTEDRVDAAVTWKEHADLRALAGRPIKLRFHLNNARLYAWRITG